TRSDRRRDRRLRPGFPLLEAGRFVRRDAAVPEARDATAPIAVFARRAQARDRIDERVPRRAYQGLERPAARPVALAPRRLRAGAVPLPPDDPARIPYRRSAGVEDLPGQTARPDEDAALHGLVGDPSPDRLDRVRRTEKPSQREARGDPRMIRIAVLGAGHWGPHLIRNFDNRQRSEVAWVIDRDRARLDEVQMRFPDVKVGDHASVAIADDSVDAVVVATPTTTHFALAKEALQHGKHTLVEKPIATSSAEAQELTGIASAAKLVLMVGHVFVFNAAVRRVKEYIDS